MVNVLWKDNTMRIVHKSTVYEKYIKRLFDIISALLAIGLFWWLFLILAIFIRIKLGSPILFRQPRPGKNGEIFNMIKFRTMTNEKNDKGELLSDEERLTKFGKWLRETSLDELPEFFLILQGKLSLVGPRPLRVSYLPLYNEHQMRRHDVKPGLTGYAQVNGRNNISWEDRFDLDVWYVDHISFVTDMKILFKTVEIVLKREGIHSETSVTMEDFTGEKMEL